MCKFFSVVSDGAGNIKFITPEQVTGLMMNGNPKEYRPNSHTSIMAFHGIHGNEETLYNKWEYDVDKKELELDQLNNKNDSAAVKIAVEAFLSGKDLIFLRNLYGMNSGARNTGNENAGNENAGYGNAGYGNAGNENAGNWNAGNRNAGYFNTVEPTIFLFNKDSGIKKDDIRIPDCLWNLGLEIWITFSDMSDQEKIDHPKAYITDGYLKDVPYKEAWAKLWSDASESDKKAVQALPNFDAAIFQEITGITV